jgi:hypothetical protein
VAERAVRALIGARKNWGGNRTQNGARAQAVLTSILQTAKQQGKNPFDVVMELLCCREKQKILDLVPSTSKTPTRPSGTPGTPRGKNDWKQNSNGKPNNWATNLSPSNPRLHNEPVQRAGGVPWKRGPASAGPNGRGTGRTQRHPSAISYSETSGRRRK